MVGRAASHVARAEERHHVGGKQERGKALRVAARVGAIEMGGVGGRQIDQPAVHGRADALQRTGRSADFKGRKLHAENINHESTKFTKFFEFVFVSFVISWFFVYFFASFALGVASASRSPRMYWMAAIRWFVQRGSS